MILKNFMLSWADKWLPINWMILIFCTLISLMSASTVLSQEAKENIAGHAFYGKMSVPTTDPNIESSSYDISIFGADVQKPFGGEIFKYGIETGAVFSWDSYVQYFRASSGGNGGTVLVSVAVDSFVMDYFFGGYIGFEPVNWFRLSVGAGPLLTWGMRQSEPEESTSDEYTAESVAEFGAGIYARACVDIFLSEAFGINAGVRKTETTLSFKDTVGETSIEGWQYYLGLAFRF
jgi:hypothetical protein